MPSVRELTDHATALLEGYIARRDEKLGAGLLPGDLCETVIVKARRWAVGVQAHLEQDVDVDIAFLREKLKEAEALVKAEYRPIPGQVRVTGDLLSESSRLQRGPSLGGIKTEKALSLERAKVLPLKARIAALQAYRYEQERGLAELRHIVKLAGLGDIALLNLLTSQWRVKLEIGGAILGKLPPAARELAAKVDAGVPADAAGNPLPDAALDREGRPDLGGVPITGEPVRATIERTGGAR